MDIKLKLRKVILDEITQETLMAGNMVTIRSPEIEVEETPIEELMMLEVGFAECESCVVRAEADSCRTLKDFDGNERMVLLRSFYGSHPAWHSNHSTGRVRCADCSSCASGCGDEEQGIRH